MGLFRDLLEQALELNNSVSEKDTHRHSVYTKYKAKFSELVGEPIIWKTKNNSNLRQPQLVIVEEAHDNYVLVKKISYSVDGNTYTIRYCILYASLYCGFDKYETLEFV